MMPEKWDVQSLGGLCEILDRKRKPITKKNRISGPYPYYGATGILDYIDGFLFDEDLVLLGEDGAKWGSGENSAFAIAGKTWVNNHAHVLKPDRSKLNDTFLIRFLNFSDLNDYVSGMTVPKLNQGQLREILIPVPLLAEQQRIVAILDEAFEGIAAATAHAERNLQNARELFQSVLHSTFSQKGDDWVETTLKDSVEETCSLSYGIVQPGEDRPGGLPIVRPTDMRQPVIGMEGLKRIDPTKADSYDRTTLTGDELLMCVRGSTGTISVAIPELKGANVTRGIVPIRFKSEIIDQRFGYYLLTAPPVQTQIKEKTYGAALMQINIRDLKKIELSYPPLPIQKAIVQKLDALSTETRRLESIYTRKLAALAELKQSLLQRAFAGEL